ncbi:hypothetical protein KC341_g45 [Hortaea werneckii]|nr:hypothetical protein KC341_g45 [Hortaea werneckii]
MIVSIRDRWSGGQMLDETRSAAGQQLVRFQVNRPKPSGVASRLHIYMLCRSSFTHREGQYFTCKANHSHAFEREPAESTLTAPLYLRWLPLKVVLTSLWSAFGVISLLVVHVAPKIVELGLVHAGRQVRRSLVLQIFQSRAQGWNDMVALDALSHDLSETDE